MKRVQQRAKVLLKEKKPPTEGSDFERYKARANELIQELEAARDSLNNVAKINEAQGMQSSKHLFQYSNGDQGIAQLFDNQDLR